MTWDAYHRRKETLRELIAIADRQRDLSLTDLLTMVDPDRTAFADQTEVLFDLQMLWFQRLSGQMDRLVTEGRETLPLMAVTAWVDAAAQLPGARALLDDNVGNPALDKARAKELTFLAASAGVHPQRHDLVARGQHIQDSARDSLANAEQAEQVADPRQGLMARLRTAIAV